MLSRLSLLSLLSLTACDPSLGDVKAKNRSVIELTQKRAELVQRAVLAATGVPDPACKPPSALHPAFDDAHDAEAISYGMLERAGAEYDPYAAWTEVPVHGRSALNTVLQDSHPTMARYRSDSMKVSNPTWLSSYSHAAKLKYLVVVRTTALDRETGTATLTAYLVEYSDTPRVLCTLSDAIAVGANLGTTGYQVVRENRKTGEKKVVRTDSHDEFQEALSRQRDRFGETLKTAWGIGLDVK